MKKGVMKNGIKSCILSGVIIGIGYIATTADYSGLTKNTGDTLTATNWNQLVDNVKGIQTNDQLNVGIGVDTAQINGKLHVSGISRFESPNHLNTIFQSSDTNNPYAYNNYNWGDTRTGYLMWKDSYIGIYADSNNSILFNGGNVGVGVSSALGSVKGKFHVNGVDMRASATVISGTMPGIYLNDTEQGGDQGSDDDNRYDSFAIEVDGNRLYMGSKTRDSSNTPGMGSRDFTLTNDGKIGIGTGTTPKKELDVRGEVLIGNIGLIETSGLDNSINIGSAGDFRVGNLNWGLNGGDVDADRFIVKANGKVGVGVEPGAKFSLEADDNTDSFLMTRTGGTKAMTAGTYLGGASSFLRMHNSDGSIGVQLNTHPYGFYTYFNVGNIGIGTATPKSKLDVDGAIKVGDNATCDTDRAGAIRYDGANFFGCNGTIWKQLDN